MEYRLVILKKAKNDIFEILTYIEQKFYNDIASLKLFENILQKYEYIKTFPQSYPLLHLHYSTKYEYRKVIMNNYTMIYYIKNKTVYISRMIPLGRDYFFDQKVSQLKEDTFEYSAV